MPYGDRTGPLGAGPMTGRGAGFCGGYGMPGYMNPVGGRGFGFGRGFGRGFGFGRGWFGAGRGFRNWFYATGVPGWARAGAWGYAAPVDEKTERSFLETQADALQRELESIRKRLSQLEKESSEE